MALLKGEQVDTYAGEVDDLVVTYTKLLNKYNAKVARKSTFNTNIDIQIASLSDELDVLKETISTSINTEDLWVYDAGDNPPEPAGYSYNELTDLTPPEEPL